MALGPDATTLNSNRYMFPLNRTAMSRRPRLKLSCAVASSPAPSM